MACVRGDERGLTQNDEQEAGHEDSGVRQIEQRQDEGVDHLRRSRTQVMGRPEGARRALRRLAELGSQRVGGLRGRRAAREGRRTSPILPMAHRSSRRPICLLATRLRRSGHSGIPRPRAPLPVRRWP